MRRNRELKDLFVVTSAVASRLPVFQKILNRHANILGDLAEQDGRNITAEMERNGSSTPIGMPELFVRTALTYFSKTEPEKNSDNLSRL